MCWKAHVINRVIFTSCRFIFVPILFSSHGVAVRKGIPEKKRRHRDDPDRADRPSSSHSSSSSSHSSSSSSSSSSAPRRSFEGQHSDPRQGLRLNKVKNTDPHRQTRERKRKMNKKK